jgi:serine/tyrosine/threonine adenylyltransferase
LNRYRRVYAESWQTDMANKLGFNTFNESDLEFVDELHRVLQLTEIDMTIFYRQLANFDFHSAAAVDDNTLIDIIRLAYYSEPDLAAITAMATWLRIYADRLAQDYILHGETNEQRKLRMNAVNPKYVLRNYMAQQAIDKATGGDFSEVKTLLQLLRNPYHEQPEYERYFAKRPEWARTKAGCSMLSCSS